MYGFDGSHEPLLSGIDVAEMIIANWKEYQLISIDDPLHPEDIASLRHLKEVTRDSSFFLSFSFSSENR
jgi:L-alanine-DL-glutamate epimerase-like enolase superfamily enzyme